MSEGAEMLLTLCISDDAGNRENRKMLIFTNQYFDMGLRKGEVLSEETFDELERCSKECLAIRKGSDLLSYSSSSRKRLVQRLKSKGIDRESAESAALRLQEIGAINEELDAYSQVESCLRKLWGKKRIYSDLIALANKMTMWVGVAIVVNLVVTRVNRGYVAVLSKQVQITVNCSKTEVGVFGV